MQRCLSPAHDAIECRRLLTDKSSCICAICTVICKGPYKNRTSKTILPKDFVASMCYRSCATRLPQDCFLREGTSIDSVLNLYPYKEPGTDYEISCTPQYESTALTWNSPKTTRKIMQIGLLLPVISPVGVGWVLQEEGHHVEVAKAGVDGQEWSLLLLLGGVVGGCPWQQQQPRHLNTGYCDKT